MLVQPSPCRCATAVICRVGVNVNVGVVNFVVGADGVPGGECRPCPLSGRASVQGGLVSVVLWCLRVEAAAMPLPNLALGFGVYMNM